MKSATQEKTNSSDADWFIKILRVRAVTEFVYFLAPGQNKQSKTIANNQQGNKN
jgi:hypothetical protein